MSRITAAEFQEIMRESLPFAQNLGPEILELSPARVTLRMPYRSDFLRPGGTISGPLLMGRYRRRTEDGKRRTNDGITVPSFEN